MNYYIDFSVEETIANDLLSRLMTAVHFCINNGATMGVDFPDFDDSFENDFGLVMRVFGTQKNLFTLLTVVSSLTKSGLVTATPINDAPRTLSTIVFVRDRQAESCSPSAMRRKEQRAKDRGEAPSYKELNYVKHYLKMQSKSGNMDYVLNIRKGVECMEGGNSFGLGIQVPCF